MMMQSEAVIHVPTPGCRKHAFLPERNGRTGRGTLPTISKLNLESVIFGNNNGGGHIMVLSGSAAGGAPDFANVRTDSAEVPKIPPPGDAWLVPRISMMHGACTNYPCASNS